VPCVPCRRPIDVR